MKNLPFGFYFLSILGSFFISLVLTPAVRAVAVRLKLFDLPDSGHSVKTHKVPTPSLGGIAIWIAFIFPLLAMRFFTHFPTGTLRSLRGVLAGGGLLFILGLIDDLRKPKGLSVLAKFLVQVLAAALIISFGMRIKFLSPEHFAIALTILWVVGVTNAFNLIDIMDGLAGSQAAVAALGFLVIALPSEDIYVNFAAASLLGAVLGFLPFNLSSKYKIFMGDCGALSIGFVLSAISLGTRYSMVNPLGVYAPLLILGVPVFDTLFVMAMRGLKGMSPFKGSKDHFPLRLEALGMKRPQIAGAALAAALMLSACAFLVTHLSSPWAVGIYALVLALALLLSLVLAKAKGR